MMCGCMSVGPRSTTSCMSATAAPSWSTTCCTGCCARLYPKVTYVRNLTDVEDKINARAAELGVPIETLTEQTTADFHQDIAALGALPPDVEPRATGHIHEMIDDHPAADRLRSRL